MPDHDRDQIWRKTDPTRRQPSSRRGRGSDTSENIKHLHEHIRAIDRKLDVLSFAVVEGFKAMAQRDQEVLDALNALKGAVASITPALVKIDTDVTTLTDAVNNGQQEDGSISAAGATAILAAVADIRASADTLKTAADAIDARTADPVSGGGA